MVDDLTLAADPRPWAAETWWARRRLRYNIGLLVAGALGFVAYAAAVSRCIGLRAPGKWQVTILTILFQGIAYLVMIGVANLCYYLGPWSERLLHPSNIAKYRKVVFRLGFWFSVLLPFTPSVLLVFSCSFHRGEDTRITSERQNNSDRKMLVTIHAEMKRELNIQVPAGPVVFAIMAITADVACPRGEACEAEGAILAI